VKAAHLRGIQELSCQMFRGGGIGGGRGGADGARVLLAGVVNQQKQIQGLFKRKKEVGTL